MEKADLLKDKKVLVLTYSDIARDARIQRQLKFLVDAGAEVTLVSTGEIYTSQVQCITVTPRPLAAHMRILKAAQLLLHIYDRLLYKYFGEDEEKLRRIKPHDLIIANDLETLPLAFKFKERWQKDVPVVLDAHEFAPEQHSEDLRWRLLYRPYFYYIARKYLPQVAAMTTVSDGFAGLYKKYFGIEPVIVYNAPFYSDLDPRPVNPDDIKLVHHGGALRARKIEKLIKLMKLLDRRFSLHLVLVINKHEISYYDYLVKLARQVAPDRIHFHNPVFPPERIPGFLNQFDIGIYLLEQDNLNHMYTIPNKFFDFIQARLMNFTTPYSQDVSRITKELNIGLVTDGYTIEEAAEKLNSLSAEEIENYKKNSAIAAQKYSAEKAGEAFIELIAGL